MAQAQPSLQELIQQRSRAGFVGRGTERAAFVQNFDIPIGDPRHRFRFHVHGNAGVGKTFLVGELERLARERGALTAYVDDGVGSLPEALEAMSRQFAAQGRRLKELERLLAVHRERRHEAEAAAIAALESEPEGPSAGSMAAVRLSVSTLNAAVPVAAPFTSALDEARLARSADRLRARLSARFSSHKDVDLVMSPETVLTPVLLRELRGVASAVPWIVLFFDTYERTGPFLDEWLYKVLTREEPHGTLPGTVVVVTAGQRPLDTARWSGFADAAADVPLGPFTETEARALLAGKGVLAEPVVEEVLRLTGCLPVLVSTLAADSPGDLDEVRDPSATAVDRFLKGQDQTRRDVALAGALPRRLDADVFRAAVKAMTEARADSAPSNNELGALYGWLTALPFVSERGERFQYHDVVRAPMLRWQRRWSRHEWAAQHRSLATVFGRWRAEAESELRPTDEWKDEPWRELRLEEAYHALCARPSATSLAGALRGLVGACREDPVLGRQWARMVEEAGDAAADMAVREWGEELRAALAADADGLTRAMDLLLGRPGLDRSGRAEAHALRGRELRNSGAYERALAEYDRAMELDPEQVHAHYGRGLAHQVTGDYPAALAALDRADELVPDADWILVERGETYRMAGRFEEAVADFDRVIDLDPTDPEPVACRGVCRHSVGRYDEALADFDRALGLNEDYLWALVRRSRLFRDREEWDRAFADLDRAAVLDPDSTWVASERGEAYRMAGRFEEAVAELGRAVALDPDHASALAGRGMSRHELGRTEEALADLNRAIELEPDYSWALVMRARVRRRLADRAGMFEDLQRAVAASPGANWIETELGDAYRLAGRHEEAIAAFHRVVERDPDNASALSSLGATHRVLKAYPDALAYLDRALAASPDYAWGYDQRARVCLAIGRTEQAVADWDRSHALDGDPGSRREAIKSLILGGRWGEALARLADADDAFDDLRVVAFQHTGQWEQARRLAERMRAEDAVPGTYQLAVIDSRTRGLETAEPLWRELTRLLETEELDEGTRLAGLCIVGWALADWDEADRRFAEALAMEPDWEVLADFVDLLTDLLNSPGADRSRVAPRLSAVTSARDAVRARYAE